MCSSSCAPDRVPRPPASLRLEIPGVRDRLGWFSAVAGIDLLAHGTTSDEETIKDTAVAQPLIVASGLVALLALFEHPADGFRVVGAGAGHLSGRSPRPRPPGSSRRNRPWSSSANGGPRWPPRAPSGPPG